MSNWIDTLNARKAGEVPGFQGADEPNEAYADTPASPLEALAPTAPVAPSAAAPDTAPPAPADEELAEKLDPAVAASVIKVLREQGYLPPAG